MLAQSERHYASRFTQIHYEATRPETIFFEVIYLITYIGLIHKSNREHIKVQFESHFRALERNPFLPPSLILIIWP